jgi:soluble lytic murein transglycosylase-like protein
VTKRTRLAVAAGLTVLVAIIIFSVVISRQRLRRHRVFRVAPAEERAKPPEGVPPVEQWTETFSRLEAEPLAELLDRIRASQPDAYSKNSLGYLHARALIEEDERDDAEKVLAPFLDPKSPFRDLALYHQAEIAAARNDDKAASALRQQLIFQENGSMYRAEAIDEEADYLTAAGSKEALAELIAKVTPSADTRQRRELNARMVEVLIRREEHAAALASGLAVLRGSISDDAADRVSRSLDKPEIVRLLTPPQRAMFGETMQTHRHFDRAIAFLSSAIPQLPAQADELQFALGRSYFGGEQYAKAQETYMRGANTTKDMRWKATFLFHSSRAVQLMGNDASAEGLLTAALAVPGTFPATTSALTQRIRVRVKAKRLAEAASDVVLLRKLAGNDHAIVDGSLAYAVGMLAAGNRTAAAAVLNALPRKLLDPYDVAEIAYWRGRALNSTELLQSVLRSRVPTHYAYFARDHLKGNRQEELKRLEASYRARPAYRAVLDLQPLPLPRFPVAADADRATLLMAMGLYDEVVDEVRAKYPLGNPASALTQAIALNRGNASRESIYAVEVLMKSVPGDFAFELLPKTLQQLLYPRYFYSFIVEDAKKYEADPTLVLSIMREESRFNPRAKSAAAARGLLQFIITTARDIGRDVGLVDVSPEDLYDPRIIIRLGAKYVSELTQEFGGNKYKAAAAYNAGPKQVAVWSRLAPAPGDDYFLAAVNFDETKDYVRKVMNSYRRYEDVYGVRRP